MEKLARRLAGNIATSLGYDSERESVIAYGLIAIIQITVTVLLVFAFGLLVHAPVEALIVCFSVSILRKYSGGAHAHDADFCTVVSVVYCTLAAVASRSLANVYHPIAMAIAIAGVYGISLWLIRRYAPVDSPNKPITSEKKIRRMRRGSFITTFVYLALQLIFYFAAGSNRSFLSYGISLLRGLSWQVLTLTPVGAILLNKLNDLPKYLRKEVSK